MFQIAICDDDIKDLEQTCKMVVQYQNQRPKLDISMRKFQSSYDLLDAVDARGCYDMYLLDILMPNINGIETGAVIRKKDSTSTIIYLTTSPDYALDSYLVDASGYLLKPFDADALYAVLDKSMERLKAEDDLRLLVHTEDGLASIPFYQLSCVEVYKRRLYCYLTDNRTMVSLTLRDRAEKVLLPIHQDKRFVQTSSSFFVNMQQIISVSPKEFLLADGTKAPISRSFSDARRIYLDYLLERGMVQKV